MSNTTINSVWRFEWFTDTNEQKDPFDLLLEYDSSPHIFSTRTMVKLWMETKGKALELRPYFCKASNPTGDKVIIPFCMAKVSYRNTWERRIVPAGEPHFDYQDPVLISNSPAEFDWESFWTALRKEVTNSRFIDLLMMVRLKGTIAPREAELDTAVASPYIVTSKYSSLEEYLSERSSGHRIDVRRQLRRLQEIGTVELKIFESREEADALDELAVMIGSYKKLWEDQQSSVLFDVPGTIQFYHTMIRELLPRGFLHFSVLQVGGLSASWHLGFLYDGVLHYYKPTYSIFFAKQSPSKVHLAMLVELAINNKWKYIDLGAGTEKYKYLWTDAAFELRQIRWRSTSLRSRACKFARDIFRFLKSYGVKLLRARISWRSILERTVWLHG